MQEVINGVFISLKDITETKSAKRQLEIAHHRLLFHLENSPLGYIEWDNELHVKSWSKRSEEIFGWNEQEFIRMRKDGYSQVYKDDLEWVSETARQLISGDLERNTLQHSNYTKDGNVIWCEWFNSILRDQNGKVITIMSLVQDITKRKEAEQHRIHHERRFKIFNRK
jgi:PAS domain S-box-containing protein